MAKLGYGDAQPGSAREEIGLSPAGRAASALTESIGQVSRSSQLQVVSQLLITPRDERFAKAVALGLGKDAPRDATGRQEVDAVLVPQVRDVFEQLAKKESRFAFRASAGRAVRGRILGTEAGVCDRRQGPLRRARHRRRRAGVPVGGTDRAGGSGINARIHGEPPGTGSDHRPSVREQRDQRPLIARRTRKPLLVAIRSVGTPARSASAAGCRRRGSSRPPAGPRRWGSRGSQSSSSSCSAGLPIRIGGLDQISS